MLGAKLRSSGRAFFIHLTIDFPKSFSPIRQVESMMRLRASKLFIFTLRPETVKAWPVRSQPSASC